MKNILKSKAVNVDPIKTRKLLNFINSVSTSNPQKSFDKDLKPLMKTLEQQFEQQNEDIKSAVGISKSISPALKTITEINKINFNNSVKLLNIQHAILGGYTEMVVDQTIDVTDKLKKNFSKKYFFLILFSFATYKFMTSFSNQEPTFVKKNIFLNLRSKTLNSLKYETILPFFEDHSNITNVLSEGFSRIALIGEKGIGKSLSVKNYCILESQQDDTLVLYFDLAKDNIPLGVSFQKLISSMSDIKLSENNWNSFISYLAEMRVLIVLDNYSYSAKELVTSAIDFSKRINSKMLIIGNNNEFSQQALDSIKEY